MILTSIGMKDSSIFTPQSAGFLNEIVEKRNAVAHGRESPKTVGRGVTSEYRADRLQVVSSTIDKIVGALTEHLCNKHFVTEVFRQQY